MNATFHSPIPHFVMFLCDILWFTRSVEDSLPLFVGTILFLLVWALLCSFCAQLLRDQAAADIAAYPDQDLDEVASRAKQWLDDITECKSAVSIIGTLFVFTLVFRFNACYDR